MRVSTDWRRRVRNGVAGVAAAAAVCGSIGIAYADPTIDPSPAPAPSTAAGPMTTPSLVATAAPKPTVAVEGGAAAGASATANAATATKGDALDQLAEEYAVGAGGGQLSNLLKTALKLRAMGYKPSKQYLDEIQKAMTYRPNQLPLIGALKDTIAYQQKLKAQMDVLTKAQSAQNGANSAVMGAAPMPGPSNPANLIPGASAPQAAAAAAPPVIVAPTS